MTSPRATQPLSVPAAPQIAGAPEENEKDISAVSLMNVLLRHRVMIVTLALAIGAYAGARSVTSSRYYTTEAKFMPRGARGQGQLGGIAAQFGINLGSGDPSSNPQLYTDLLETRSLLWPVAEKTYRMRTDTGVVSGDLEKIFNIRDPRPAVRKAKVISALKGAIRSTLAAKTGVISVSVATANPELSLQIAQNLLDQVNIYNLSQRQNLASLDRAFVERQLGEKRAELRQAESELESFLEGNRQYRYSPQLVLEYGRLQRQVDMRNQIYSSLLSAYETARIEEVRDLPVITVIEAPELPIGPDSRGGVRKTAIGILIGLVLGSLLAFGRDRMARGSASQSDEFVEFAALRHEAMGDLTHPWRPLARAFGSRRKA
ncbi:MAG: hypothetical protein Q7S20_10920 [Gemmatimonadaceae bacterium]|nr:hypothetical protein [Gemmatimonadaceae bacterium]